ncbi:hypothetical protein JWG45_21660 [Leptospira sp. 201903070]|uniref:Uncharacterized protein n=1 Tax=Leptospira ainlahdjerensis TaxID=2810033 RepID=A0ABS2UH93_9LEPT|nr:hypothetical protein [Leptospira ainlahdjerensis]MBM9579760.1 hypothetical protein [Leptospira ainlahdjerensis]
MTEKQFSPSHFGISPEEIRYKKFVESIYEKQNEGPHRYGGGKVDLTFISELFKIIFACYFSDLIFRDFTSRRRQSFSFFLQTKSKLYSYLSSWAFRSILRSTEFLKISKLNFLSV